MPTTELALTTKPKTPNQLKVITPPARTSPRKFNNNRGSKIKTSNRLPVKDYYQLTPEQREQRARDLKKMEAGVRRQRARRGATKGRPEPELLAMPEIEAKINVQPAEIGTMPQDLDEVNDEQRRGRRSEQQKIDRPRGSAEEQKHGPATQRMNEVLKRLNSLIDEREHLRQQNAKLLERMIDKVVEVAADVEHMKGKQFDTIAVLNDAEGRVCEIAEGPVQ